MANVSVIYLIAGKYIGKCRKSITCVVVGKSCYGLLIINGIALWLKTIEHYMYQKATLKAGVLSFLLFSGIGFAQETTKDKDNLYEMSLEELMNIPIKSASKKEETLFNAPLSSYTITRADIEKAGSTSIMEALRLAPGVIVREQSNGVYDIHIRGFDNLLRYSTTYTKSNLTTLVMIDNRPVFNHNTGGTFWETLPIDLNDVERIEIVRGPSAPMFGPNAVTGVINIITKQAVENKNYAVANVQYGSSNTMIANGSYGKNLGKKLSFIVSGNYQDRERFDNTYYQIPTGKFVEAAQLSETAALRFPNPGRSLNKWGGNAFLHYAPTEKISVDASAGFSESDVQKIFLGIQNTTFFTTNRSDTRYANLAADVHGVQIRSSVVNGHDNINYKTAPSEYDYTTFDINAEYGIKLGSKYLLTPGISYQDVAYTDEKYTTDRELNNGFINSKRSIQTLAGFLRADLNLTDHWRVLAALRMDKFSTPDQVRLAYEFATTYKLNDKHLLRAAITRSNSGSFIANNYLDIHQSPNSFLTITQKGNTDLNLVTVQMFEIGYRAQLSKSFQVDLDVFQQTASNLSAILLTGFAPAPPFPAFTPQTFEFRSIPTQARQVGGTLSLNFIPNDRIQIKPFVTVQHTETQDLPADFIDPSLNPGLQYTTNTHKNTPSVYGGYFVNVKALKRLDVNLNGYYFSKHNQYDAIDKTGEGALGSIKGRFLFNAKVNYGLTSHLNLFVSGRNALNSSSREFFGADQIRGLYLTGITFKL